VAEMPSPAAVMAAAIGQMPGMKASGATPATVAARAAVSRDAREACQRLVPYQTPAIALPAPYSPSSGPAAARSPWRVAKAMVARSTATNIAPRQTVIAARLRRAGLRSAPASGRRSGPAGSAPETACPRRGR
jgi:hypothetical protein